MKAYVEEQWESANFVEKQKPAAKSSLTEKKGHTGNVVPFFPSEWKKNANDVFNLIMNGPMPTEDNYDETTHAAIFKKVPDKVEDDDLSPFLQNKKPNSTAIANARPTSGKHYAREHQYSKRKGDLE